MIRRYVPILRFKAGERIGLSNVSSGGRSNVSPLIVIAPEQFVGKKATKHLPAVPPAGRFAAEMQACWGSMPFFLDALAVPGGASHHPFQDIAAECRSIGLSLVPCTSLYAPAQYSAAVNAVAAADGRGVALRIDLQELATSSSWVPGWSSPNTTDLIIDCGANVAAAHALGPALHPAFQNLTDGPLWRSVTVAGASMAENFTGVAAGTFTLPRLEWMLWQSLSSAALPYTLDYGDYATLATTPAPTGIAWGFPINVKYSLPTEFLICRGVRTTGISGVDMDVQLLGHAQSIVAYHSRGALAHCWADDAIDQIAAGSAGPGNLVGWVGLSVNRHIEITRFHLP